MSDNHIPPKPPNLQDVADHVAALEKRAAELADDLRTSEKKTTVLEEKANRAQELEKEVRGLHKDRNIIYGMLAMFGICGAAAVMIQWNSVQDTHNDVRLTKDALEQANVLCSQSNLISKANCVLTNVLADKLEAEEGYQILLPASRLWLNSGIHVDAGDVIKIRISGGVNTSISDLLLNDIEQTPLRYPWKQLPDDDNVDIATPVQIRKAPSLIKSSEWYRDVLMFVAKDQNEENQILSDPTWPSQDRIVDITPKSRSWDMCEYTQTMDSPGFLSFIVDDHYPTSTENYQYQDRVVDQYVKSMAEISQFFTNRAAEVALPPDVDARDLVRWALRFRCNPPNSSVAFKEWETNTWERLSLGKDNRVFYDDNIGDYLLQIRIIRSKNNMSANP